MVTRSEVIRECILSRLTPHTCTEDSCGGYKAHHEGCFELSSDDFIVATKMTAKKPCGNPLAPD